MKKFDTKKEAMRWMKKNIGKKYKNTDDKASVKIKNRKHRIHNERSYGRGSESKRRG